MANLVANNQQDIQFVNSGSAKSNELPTLLVQSGDWQIADHVEAGVVFDTYGAQPPILTSNDARKLAKWLMRAADDLDGVKNNADKKKNKRHYNQEEDDDIDNY